ncbi:hypothetical protein [Streptosporangium roseum]|uniref:Uncharacterized protein n=1 Tax=Streptosporangium roseum (strain ATCC 12428 / DSM 43021 / JCM 3005 / KCTC 9067 / NCIMB 10171 / NRRL 2505 / NI 9100) TaxID=479432 RepID=D2AW45_STRRD|nr:hypothetical protein [Streptosporangium roseum]ACZ84998.1 hypothetical protein Sros_2010 [Streptosporangium roseum DSM 43021]
MTQTLPISWWDRAWHIAAYAALIAATGSAAVLLVTGNLDAGRSLWPDPNDFQLVGVWRMAAVLAHTAGSSVGHVCAMLAGLLAAHWTRLEAGRTGVVTALGAGAGLGLVNLVSASWTAAPLLRELASSPGLMNSDGMVVIEPDLQHHGSVLAGMVVVFVAIMIAAGLGFTVAHVRPLSKLVLILVSLALIPIVHFLLPVVLVSPPL